MTPKFFYLHLISLIACFYITCSPHRPPDSFEFISKGIVNTIPQPEQNGILFHRLDTGCSEVEIELFKDSGDLFISNDSLFVPDGMYDVGFILRDGGTIASHVPCDSNERIYNALTTLTGHSNTILFKVPIEINHGYMLRHPDDFYIILPIARSTATDSTEKLQFFWGTVGGVQ